MVDPIIQWFLNLFPAMEWRAFIWIIIATLAATHTIKIVWRRWIPMAGGGHGHISIVSAIASIVLSFFLWPSGSGPWWIAGIICGPASNIAFKIGFALLKKFVPDVAMAINMDRRKDSMPIPPEGTPDRRQ